MQNFPGPILMDTPLPAPDTSATEYVTPSDPDSNAPRIVLPHRNLRSLYRIYLLVAVWVGILSWLLPLAFVIPPESMLLLSGSILLLVIFLFWWTGAFVRTIRYCITPADISWEKGVWFHQTGRVPYKRISSVEIVRGPVSSRFGISDLRIRIAGGAGSGSSHDLKIRGLTNAGMMRDYILSRTPSSS